LNKDVPKIKTINNALAFHCPACKTTHQVDLAKWQWNQDEHSPTINTSVNVRIEPTDKAIPVKICRSFIYDGKIEFMSDCTHSMAGQTPEIPEIN
jgi:Family of unknown function (DUF6527)